MDQDSERDFDWENNIRISYEGHEDDIVQKVEAGNISLSLPSTKYVTFSGKNQGLFGIKAISKLGPVDITTIASIEKTKKEQIRRRFRKSRHRHRRGRTSRWKSRYRALRSCVERSFAPVPATYG